MNDLHRDILEEFAAFTPKLDWQRDGYSVVDPLRRAEQRDVWRAAHPLKQRIYKEVWRRRQGMQPMSARRKPFTDQHGTVYQTLVHARALTGVAPSSIHQVLKGRQRSAKGYEFKYIGGENETDT